ncbi:hypothetical protein GF362_03720 [Candidatus Dojkabacteria bacterium]|nr:hypothetical protein [Candidatus Dojkabacteria bacterium]
MFKSTSSKIILGIVAVTSAILMFVSTVTIYRTEKELGRFIENRPILFKILRKAPDPAAVKLEREFKRNLYTTITFANILGFGLAVIAGTIIAKQITKPLSELEKGIKKLKKNKYKFKLKHTDVEEFDIVIDEFNNLIKELDRVEKLRQDLVSDVSHELKTPLTSILGQLEGILDQLFDPDPKRIKTIKKQVERLSEMVEKLQDYTRIRSKTADLKLQNIKIHKIFSEVENMYSQQLKNKNIRFVCNIDTDLTIRTDKLLLLRVITNLIDNAIKYSGGNEIICKADKEKIVIEDNGIGIDEKHLDLIFERFYRVEKSRSRKTGGLGLGLSIVKEIVEAHGWEIHAERVKNNNGVRFIIHLKN